MAFEERIALTFGDAGENHIGMEMVGSLGEIGSGFTIEELHKMKDYFGQTNIVQLAIFEEGDQKGAVLIVRQYVKSTEHAELFREMNSFEWDTKYWDTRRGRVLNKRARSNVVILDGIRQEPDYENKKGRIVDSHTIEHFGLFKHRMVDDITSSIENDKGQRLICEGNRYFNMKKCGIGYHGDAERRKVIALSLGASSKMNWQWFKNSKPVGSPYEFTLHSGDLYIMSEKAVGHDWKKRSKLTLRHAAGATKYTSLSRFTKK